MKLPPLTAELSLYQSHGHYRTNAGTSPVESFTRTIISIAQGDTGTTWVGGGDGIITVPGTEIITVHSCPPGYEEQGGRCVPIGGPTLTFTDGGTQGGRTQVGGGTGSGGKTGGKKTGNGRDGGDYNPTEGGKCCGGNYLERGTYKFTTFARPDGTEYSDWGCCQGGLCGGCVTTNGASEFCKDGWCFRVSSVPPSTLIAQG